MKYIRFIRDVESVSGRETWISAVNDEDFETLSNNQDYFDDLLAEMDTVQNIVESEVEVTGCSYSKSTLKEITEEEFEILSRQ